MILRKTFQAGDTAAKDKTKYGAYTLHYNVLDYIGEVFLAEEN